MHIVLSNKSRKFLDRLDSAELLPKLFEMIDYLAIDPIPYKKYDVKRIKGTRSSYRLRKGDFRIEYSVSAKNNIVYIVSVGRRKKAYK